jgi:hypothetical protein
MVGWLIVPDRANHRYLIFDWLKNWVIPDAHDRKNAVMTGATGNA